MAGLLDSIVGSNDPATADPNSGLVESQRRQLLFNTLGSTGALLLAAGQNIMPAQRAQLLSQLGNVPGQTQQMSTEMAQQNLLNQRQQYVRNQNQQEKEMQAYVGTPDFTSALNALPPVLKQMAIAKIKGGDHAGATKMVSDYVQMAIQAQREAAALANAPPTVAHDVNGNPWAYDRVTRGWNPILPMNKDPYGLNGGNAPIGGSPAVGAGVAPQGGQPSGPTMAGGILVHPNYPNASIDPSVPYNKAFGAGGAMDYTLGRVLGTAGLSNSDERNAQNAAVAQFDKARTELLNEARTESPGSARIKAAYNTINETLPVAGSLFHDAPYAQKQLVAARDSIAKHMSDTSNILTSPGFSKHQRDQAAIDMMSLRKNYDNLRVITDSLNSAGPVAKSQSQQPAPPSGGFDPAYDYRVKPDGSGWQRKPK